MEQTAEVKYLKIFNKVEWIINECYILQQYLYYYKSPKH